MEIKRRSLSLLAALALSGCPDPTPRGTEPAASCRRAYEKCTLPTGVLGVCDPVDCAVGQPEPCLVCRSQH